MSDRSHVGMSVCFYCGKDDAVILHRRLAQVLPRRAVYDKRPCKECASHMEQGVILISVDEEKSGGDMKNPYRTGGFAVVRDEAIERMVNPPELRKQILEARVAFIPDEVWKHLGLPQLESTN